ncbi:MAG: S-layer homology domain-containing protein, partial [Clostridia bacterium]|nr:S-layer homology domain-containing protein [Clostridia bacterium]
GQMITREEMAVILKRAMDYTGWNGELNGAKEFTDGQDISDYAVGSIAAMSAAGIINGMPDGRFMPAANATRAQAAKIICGVYANE